VRLLLANPNTSQAETLAALRPRKAAAGSFRRPAAQAMAGLPAPLMQLFGGTDRP
jgi:hypothetical protein